MLIYVWGSEDEQRTNPAAGNCLQEFIELADATETQFPNSVLSFARRWGPLELCEHAKPFRHQAYPKCGYPTSTASDPSRNEPLEAWRRYARHLKGLLLVAANLCNGRPGDLGDWEAVANGEPKGLPQGARDWGPPPDDLGRGKGRVVQERLTVSFIVSRWFKFGEVALFPQWRTMRANVGENWFEIDTNLLGFNWSARGRTCRCPLLPKRHLPVCRLRDALHVGRQEAGGKSGQMV